MTLILVLDDGAADRNLMAIALGQAGHTVVEAAGGELALTLARAARPDLVVADIVMPGMNGYEFVRRLREDPELGDTPVIFCTANYLEGEVHQLAAACGVSRFISKPCAPEVVLETIAQALGGSEAAPPSTVPGPESEREELRVLNEKLVEKVAELERVNAHRRDLLSLVMNAQEQERRRIAEGVHADSLQTVAAVGLRLAVLRHHVEDPEAIDALEQLQESVRLAAQRLRSLLFELGPPELQIHGFVSALRAYFEFVKSEEGLDFAIHDLLAADPDPETHTLMYRVAQEVLMNVRKHAQASRVEVTLTAHNGRYVVTVCDDGVGFNVARALRARPGHLGLAALTERLKLAGGDLRIESTLGAGATVEFEVPAHDTASAPVP